MPNFPIFMNYTPFKMNLFKRELLNGFYDRLHDLQSQNHTLVWSVFSYAGPFYILGFARGEYCRGALPSYESGLAEAVRLISRESFLIWERTV